MVRRACRLSNKKVDKHGRHVRSSHERAMGWRQQVVERRREEDLECYRWGSNIVKKVNRMVISWETVSHLALRDSCYGEMVRVCWLAVAPRYLHTATS